MYDLIVIGGGPAGYVGAIRGAQLGMKVLLIEREHLGGTCLNVGCIPTKALFQSAEAAETVKKAAALGIDAQFTAVSMKGVMERKAAIVKQLVSGVAYLMKKNKVDVVMGTAQFTGPRSVLELNSGTVYEGKHILIAAGSQNGVPPIPGLDGTGILGSTELLELTELPDSLAIIGGGVIGCELAGILNSFGVEVTILEMQGSLLANLEPECAHLTEREFTARGIRVLTDTKVKTVADREGRKEILCQKGNEELSVKAQYVLVATGRRPCTEGLGLELAGIKTEKGFIAVDSAMETSVPGVYAAGDVAGKSFLAHGAYEEAAIAVENMNGANRQRDSRAMPKAVFIDTELSSVGMGEEEAKAAGYDVLIGQFQLGANGKALAMGKTSGFVKVVAEKKNHEILGIHMAGPAASELVAAGASLISMEALLEDVEAAVYPHPSVSEAIREACLNALGRGVHS